MLTSQETAVDYIMIFLWLNQRDTFLLDQNIFSRHSNYSNA